MRFFVFLLAACAFSQTPAPTADDLRPLLAVRRVYVEKLSGGETAVQIRDMIISALQNSRLFAVTENPDRADATLKGSAEDLVFTDTFQSSEGLSTHSGIGNLRQSGRSSGVASRGISLGASEQESYRSAERKHEAVSSVRLVNKEGDVIWSTTQESLGGKFRGSSSDVADKITRRLAEDFAKARELTAAK